MTYYWYFMCYFLRIFLHCIKKTLCSIKKISYEKGYLLHYTVGFVGFIEPVLQHFISTIACEINFLIGI